MSFEPVWTSSSEDRSKLPKIEFHPAFERMLSKMPIAARSSFSMEQLAVLAKVTKPPKTPHLIDYRVSLPFLGGRYYLTVLFGRERRLLDRIKSEGQASVLKSSVVYVAILWFLVSVCLLSALLAMYVLKSAIGVDVFSGPSVVHDYMISVPPG